MIVFHSRRPPFIEGRRVANVRIAKLRVLTKLFTPLRAPCPQRLFSRSRSGISLPLPGPRQNVALVSASRYRALEARWDQLRLQLQQDRYRPGLPAARIPRPWDLLW